MCVQNTSVCQLKKAKKTDVELPDEEFTWTPAGLEGNKY